jgi:hypothetical protein
MNQKVAAILSYDNFPYFNIFEIEEINSRGYVKACGGHWFSGVIMIVPLDSALILREKTDQIKEKLRLAILRDQDIYNRELIKACEGFDKLVTYLVVKKS